MSNNDSNVQSASSVGTWGQIIGRLVAAAIILAVTAFFTPGFTINNIWALGLAAVVLTAMDYLIITICNSILCKWLFNILDGSNNWCSYIWNY